MAYNFPIIKVSDRSVKGVHTFWGKGSHGWSPLMGLKQVEPPYLYGYGVRIARRFVGLCRERNEERPLLRELDIDTQEITSWGSDEQTEASDSPQVLPS